MITGTADAEIALSCLFSRGTKARSGFRHEEVWLAAGASDCLSIGIQCINKAAAAAKTRTRGQLFGLPVVKL